MTGVPTDEAEVLQVNQRFYDAIETADLDAMHDIWLAGPDAPSAQCVHPGWTPLHGRDAVLRSWAVIMAGTTYIQFVLTDVRVSMTGDVAMVSCG